MCNTALGPTCDDAISGSLVGNIAFCGMASVRALAWTIIRRPIGVTAIDDDQSIRYSPHGVSASEWQRGGEEGQTIWKTQGKEL